MIVAYRKSTWFGLIPGGAIAALLISAVHSFCAADEPEKKDGYSQGRITKATSLNAAIEMCRNQLTRQGKPEYAALVGEQRIKKALRQAIEDYEAWLTKKPSPPGGDPKYFQDTVKPTAMKIVNDGKWPGGCSLSWFPDVLDGEGRFKEGFHLRLSIDTPGQRQEGFAFPIADVSFGRWYVPATGTVGERTGGR